MSKAGKNYLASLVEIQELSEKNTREDFEKRNNCKLIEIELAEKTYTKKQIAEIAGISGRMVQFYTEEEIIKPEIDPGIGRGKVRRYSKKNLIDFCLLKSLIQYGVTVAHIKKFFESFKKKDLILEIDIKRLQYEMRLVKRLSRTSYCLIKRTRNNTL